MPDEDLLKQKQSAERAHRQISESLTRSNWAPVLERHRTLSQLMGRAANEAGAIAQAIDPEKERAADRRLVIAFHDTVRDIRDEIQNIREGKPSDARRGPPNPRGEPEPIDARTQAALNQMLTLVNEQATGMNREGLFDPLAERRNYPGTPAEAEEYAVTALRYAQKQGKEYRLDFGPALAAAGQIANDKGELQPEGVASFQEALNRSVDLARNRQQELRNTLNDKRTELRELRERNDDRNNNPPRPGSGRGRNRPPPPRQNPPRGNPAEERLEAEIKGLETQTAEVGRIGNQLQDVGSNVNRTTRTREAPAPREEPPLTFKDRKEALAYLSTMTDTERMGNIEINGANRSNISLVSALNRIEHPSSKNEITRALGDIRHQSVLLRTQEEVTPEQVRPMLESLDRLHLNLRVMTSEQGRDIYSDRDREGAAQLQEFLKPVEETLRNLEAKKYGMASPEQDKLASLVPSDMAGGPRYAAAEAETVVLSGGPSVSNPRSRA